MTGNGTPTDLQGPLARMWRDVYAKAAGVAEGRTTELLKQHVYHYPHGAGGEGGGGGGLVELGRAVATAGQVTMRVPASGALPTGYSGLVVVGTGRTNHATGNRDVYLFFNDLVSGPLYNYGQITGNLGAGTVSSGGSSTAGAVHLGFAPPLDAAQPQTVFGCQGTIPLHEETALPKVGLFLSTYLRTQTGGPAPITTTAVYAPSPAAAITSVHLRCLTDGWRAGATLVVYGFGPATGDGGGGTTDVTISTDASLSATEPTPNSFSLAARLSPDAGNALSLHANGLYATDTGSGGGGTGNTTMHTQTSAPTGAANSLWFNPSESA